MSTKRERYELAAHAAGLSITWKTGNCKGGPFEAAFIGDKPWRPEDDGGDALRLQVYLRMPIWFDGDTSVIAGQYKCGDPGWRVETGLNDLGGHAAVRRAIFLAAIDIGKAML